MKTQQTKQQHYAFWVKLASTAAVVTALTLIALKLYAWLVTDSASMLASLTDSLLDGGASLFSFFAIRYAIQPADDEHRFGHGKAESLAALAQSAFISGSALLLVFHSIQQWLHGQPPQRTDAGIYVSIAAIVLTLILLTIQKRAIHHTRSQAVQADSLHYQSDIMLNLTVLVALLLSQWGLHWADSAFALLIAVYLLWGAAHIGKDAFQSLMDRELPIEQQQLIMTHAAAIEGVRGVHGLRTRSSGPTTFIQLHIELDNEISLLRAHAIADQVETAIMQQLPDADILVHMDPLLVVPLEPR
ncbi:cation diffusion facilitator family transporter [Idiomarina xiamenensis]|uniref:Cation-efflux pump FieF n=1 Tax=Idiomarina xiamenensis 10-D-4 TaxID=740709 RepID=K2KTG2_9GAMM|nr:cation diffusion facilitator family transporter [Idiomarina xiamenensis]EKE80925.1 cation transporter [Idiomarina xiamenensis 10-D-4]